MTTILKKRALLVGLIGLYSFSAAKVFAIDGTAGSGGGSYIESVFRIKALELVRKIKKSPEANSLCAADLAQTTLESTEIRVVDKLKNLSTGELIDNAIFDAWTQNQVIQLKQEAWEKLFFNPADGLRGRALNTLILHEVFRATGSCNDEAFVLSDRATKIIRSITLTGKTWEFKKVEPINSSRNPPLLLLLNDFDSDIYTGIACDQKVEMGAKLSCLISNHNQTWPKFSIWSGLFSPETESGHIGVGKGRTVLESVELSEHEFYTIENMTSLLQEGIIPSFLIQLDLQTFQLSFGVDNGNLIPILGRKK